MDTFTTTNGNVAGAYGNSIELTVTGQISTDNVVINARGDIAGTYQDSTGEHGFLQSASSGTTTSFDGVAGGHNTGVTGLDTAGDVIGTSIDSQGVRHAYVYRNGAATTVDLTGWTSSTVTATDASGTFGGTYTDGGGTHAFVDTVGGTPATITVPDGATVYSVGAVDAAGDAAGTATGSHGYYSNEIFVRLGTSSRSVALPNGGYDANVVGMNQAGTVVGTYYQQGMGYVAFTLAPDATSVTPITIANGSDAQAVGIDAAGDVVGTYYDSVADTQRGFVRSASGIVTPIDGSSSATSTSVSRVDAAGNIFGSYTDSDNQQHAFVDRAGIVTTIPTLTGAQYPNATGQDGAGDVIGSYDVNGEDPSFIDRNGTITQITATGHPELNVGFIDAAGNLIGTVSDSDGTHAFVDKGGIVTTFDGAVGAQATAPVGTDAAGDIFGNYTDASGAQHGFVESGGAVSTIDGANGARSSTITAVNASGTFAGTYQDGQGTRHAFVGSGGTVTSFDVANSSSSYAIAVDAAGDVFGQADGQTTGGFVRTAAGDVTTFSVDGANYTYLTGADAAGDAFGYTYSYGNGFNFGFQMTGFVRSAAGAITTYAGPAGASQTQVQAIDAAGDVFGSYRGADNAYHLFEVKAGTTDYTTIDAPSGSYSLNIVGIDAAGDVAANFYSSSGGTYHSGALLEIGGTVTEVKGSAGATQTRITGIGAAGDVFGTYQDAAGTHAFASFVADMPTIAGTHASATSAEATVPPFAGLTLGGGTSNRTTTVTIALSGGGGTLRDGAGYGGLARNADGSYTLSGTAAAVTAELGALGFTPTAPAAGTAATTTFTLTEVSGIGGTATGTATDATTTVTDTAAAAVMPAPSPAPVPAPMPAPAPTPAPTPASPGAVSIDGHVSYNRGTFTLTGSASSAAGVAGVEISAVLGDGTRQDLGTATLNGDGTFAFADRIGANQQGFFEATLTDGAGVRTVSADPGFSLAGGLGQGAFRAEQTSYTGGGTELGSTSLFRAGGSRAVDVQASGQTLISDVFDTFDNHGAADNTFVFNPGHGLDVINQFRVGGTDHDSLSFSGSDFGNGIATVLHNARNAGADVVIRDPTSGDTVKLTGVTKQQLVANRGDFSFHA